MVAAQLARLKSVVTASSIQLPLQGMKLAMMGTQQATMVAMKTAKMNFVVIMPFKLELENNAMIGTQQATMVAAALVKTKCAAMALFKRANNAMTATPSTMMVAAQYV